MFDPLRHGLFRVSVKWLEGGREDEFHVLAAPPLNLGAVAYAIRNHEGGVDESMDKMADQVEDAWRRGSPQVNDTTRFVAITGLSQNQPVVIEIQALCFVSLELKFDQDPYARVVDLGTSGG